jgi:excisionase family DNA binding protein
MESASDELLTPEKVAAYLQIPRQTLYAWRTRGRGPRSLKVGRHVRYRREDVEAWLTYNAGSPAHRGA